jgi:hypothetical protein
MTRNKIAGLIALFAVASFGFVPAALLSLGIHAALISVLAALILGVVAVLIDPNI